MFAFQTEREERGDDDDEGYLDPFVDEGETSSSSDSPSNKLGSDNNQDHTGQAGGRNQALSAARRFQLRLQEKLF